MKDEQVTFDGIPIPLTMETLLDAMAMAYYEKEVLPKPFWQIRHRQYRAFRERILRVDAEKDVEIAAWQNEVDNLEVRLSNATFNSNAKDARIAELLTKRDHKDDLVDGQRKTIRMRDRQIRERDARIAELEERREIIDVDKHRLWDINKELKERIAELETAIERILLYVSPRELTKEEYEYPANFSIDETLAELGIERSELVTKEQQP